MITPINLVLDRLDKVKQRQSNQWSARCPSHDDKSPSLSIRESSDGGVLIHCFSGCSFNEVIQALGLNPSDLYPPKTTSPKAPKRLQTLLTPSQALDLLEFESSIIAITGLDIIKGTTPSQGDLDRCIKAVGRISYLKDSCMRYSK